MFAGLGLTLFRITKLSPEPQTCQSLEFRVSNRGFRVSGSGVGSKGFLGLGFSVLSGSFECTRFGLHSYSVEVCAF